MILFIVIIYLARSANMQDGIYILPVFSLFKKTLVIVTDADASVTITQVAQKLYRASVNML